MPPNVDRYYMTGLLNRLDSRYLGEKIMQKINEQKLQELQNLAKLLTVTGVRNNTGLENLHSGITPSSKTGDYTDVKIVTPYGEIEWNQLSRISDKEMRSLMLSIERALEATLCLYESLGNEDKKAVIKNIMAERTYDLQDYIVS